jgi:hypothetical protein
MGTFVSRAREAGSCLLVVTRSSNPEGRAVQSARDDSGRQVDEGLLHEIGELNRTLAPGPVGPVGAVVAPVSMEPELDLADAQALFLAPGVGAQGARPRGTWPGSPLRLPQGLRRSVPAAASRSPCGRAASAVHRSSCPLSSPCEGDSSPPACHTSSTRFNTAL